MSNLRPQETVSETDVHDYDRLMAVYDHAGEIFSDDTFYKCDPRVHRNVHGGGYTLHRKHL